MELLSFYVQPVEELLARQHLDGLLDNRVDVVGLIGIGDMNLNIGRNTIFDALLIDIK